MKLLSSLFGERSLTLVAATFNDRRRALRAFQALRMVSPRQLGVALIAPCDERLARKMEPESDGIWHTLLRTHGWLGLAGAFGGLMLALLVLVAGWPAALASPLATLMIGAVYGGFVGLLVAGLLTLRPDRTRLTAQVRAAGEQGCWAVVSHPRSAHQADVAQDMLTLSGGRVLRSL